MPTGKEAITAVVVIAALCLAGCKEDGVNKESRAQAPVATARGEQLFRERCAPCHPNGGNTINPRKTLHGSVLADYGITTAADIVKVLRHPGPGMPKFDQTTIPEQDAKLIGEYVLATFR